LDCGAAVNHLKSESLTEITEIGPEVKQYVFPLPIEMLEFKRVVSPAFIAKVGAPRDKPLGARVYG